MDYEDDYNFLTLVFNKLNSEKHTELSELFDVLGSSPQLLKINSHVTPKYVKNRELAEKLDLVTRIDK